MKGETKAAPPSAPQSFHFGPGAVIGDRYEVLAALGQGGMGAVYRVRDRELGEDVALKLLRPDFAEAEGALDRFRREVKLARRVTHPNVARTYDLGSEGSLRWLTMELISGVSLAHLLHERPPALVETLRIASEIARGLAAAHAAGVVHRDLKPDNVMLEGAVESGRSLRPPSSSGSPGASGPGGGERVVITDFGIARLASSALAAQTRALTVGMVIGTPAYMAPEQVEGKDLDGRADVYAFGVLLFEMLTMQLPFVGDTPYAQAAARLSAPAPDVRTLDATIPEPVAALVSEMLARARDDRPDVQRVLERLVGLRGGGLVAAARVLRLLPAASLSRPTPVGPRTVAMTPLLVGTAGKPDAEATQLARDLDAALGDAFAGDKSVRVVVPSTVRSALGEHSRAGVLDPASLGRALSADLVLEGTVQRSANAVRVRLHLVEQGTGTQTWAAKIDGDVVDGFALEDGAVAALRGALSLQNTGEAARGPSDPAVRALWEQGRAVYVRFGPPERLDESVRILREALALAPNDPWVTSALGAALTRLWLLRGAVDRELIAEAEELALRALAADSTIGDTFATIGILRLQHGEMRSAVRAFQEALQRDPNHGEAHGYLGRLLAESGWVEEGLKQLDSAIRLDPASISAYAERARTLALLGDMEGAQASIGQSERLGSLAAVYTQARFVMWNRDYQLAIELLERIDKAGQAAGFARTFMLPILGAFVRNEPVDGALDLFRQFATESSASPRQRAFFFQLSAEYYCAAGLHEEALGAIEHAAELPLIDLLWLDRCPILAVVRDDPRFASARAVVSARVAELWS